jgi:hypothetical protein
MKTNNSSLDLTPQLSVLLITLPIVLNMISFEPFLALEDLLGAEDQREIEIERERNPFM